MEGRAMSKLIYKCTKCGIEFESQEPRTVCPDCNGTIKTMGHTNIDGKWIMYRDEQPTPIRSAGMVLRVKDYRLEIAEAYMKLYRKYEPIIEGRDKQREARHITDKHIADLYREEPKPIDIAETDNKAKIQTSVMYAGKEAQQIIITISFNPNKGINIHEINEALYAEIRKAKRSASMM
jgi:DNA-directed RNA polymerase subunit RPC12/RpoP